jgi:hypothetical protein
MFNNLSSLQRNFIRDFIRDCFIFLGLITWPVFGFVSVMNEWKLCYPIFLAPFIFLALFIIVMGIYMFIIRLRFKWQIMGVLTKEEYNSVIHKLWLYSWNFNEIYNVETNPLFLEVLDRVRPFWNSRLEW